MIQSRRSLFYQATSFVRSNPQWRGNYVSRLSSIPLKNQGGSTPEDLSKLYRSPEESEEDDMATRGLRLRGESYDGPGPMNVGNGRVENAGERWRDDAGEPRETSGSVAQTAKVAAVGAVETGLRLGKMAKQAADGLWEAAEKTAENVKESVAEGSSDGRGGRAGTFDELDNRGGVRAGTFDELDNRGGGRAGTFDELDNRGGGRAGTFDELDNRGGHPSDGTIEQAADGLWEAAEKTAENVKDSVAEDSGDGRGRRAGTFDELDNRGGGHAGTFDELDNRGGRPSDGTIDERGPDEFVKDLRRRSGGYDLKDRW